MDDEQYEQSIEILKNLDDLPLKSEKLRLLFLSYCFHKVGEYELAIDTANELLEEGPDNEFASQLKYLSYCELKDFDKALNEIINFLSCNEAKLYKVTLEELLIDIENGHIPEEKIVLKIKDLALKNNIENSENE